MTEEKKAECVLRLFGVPDAAVKEAAGGFSPQWKAEARWKSRGAETLVALSAQNPAGLRPAAPARREDDGRYCVRDGPCPRRRPDGNHRGGGESRRREGLRG